MVTSEGASERYLDLMKRVLVNTIYQDPNVNPRKPQVFDLELRSIGRDWPRDAHTMVGFKRLDNIQYCVETVIKDGVPGDLIETGVWRGGASIFMQAILTAHNETHRKIWVADSFEGLPPPDEQRFPLDKNDKHHTVDFLAVSVEEVKSHFERYNLLGENVEFLEGWFSNTLPSAPVEQLSILRLDGDMYGSTWTRFPISIRVYRMVASLLSTITERLKRASVPSTIIGANTILKIQLRKLTGPQCTGESLAIVSEGTRSRCIDSGNQ